MIGARWRQPANNAFGTPFAALPRFSKPNPNRPPPPTTANHNNLPPHPPQHPHPPHTTPTPPQPKTPQVWYDPNATGPRAFVAAVESAGFDCTPAPDSSLGDDAGALQRSELEQWAKLLFWSVLFTVPLFVVAMVLPLAGANVLARVYVGGFQLDQLVKWALATPVQVRGLGWVGASGGWGSLVVVFRLMLM